MLQKKKKTQTKKKKKIKTIKQKQQCLMKVKCSNQMTRERRFKYVFKRMYLNNI